jgi:hypothetical protein
LKDQVRRGQLAMLQGWVTLAHLAHQRPPQEPVLRTAKVEDRYRACRQRTRCIHAERIADAGGHDLPRDLGDSTPYVGDQLGGSIGACKEVTDGPPGRGTLESQTGERTEGSKPPRNRTLVEGCDQHDTDEAIGPLGSEVKRDRARERLGEQCEALANREVLPHRCNQVGVPSGAVDG